MPTLVSFSKKKTKIVVTCWGEIFSRQTALQGNETKHSNRPYDEYHTIESTSHQSLELKLLEPMDGPFLFEDICLMQFENICLILFEDKCLILFEDI